MLFENIRQSVRNTLEMESKAISGLMDTYDQVELEKVLFAIMECKGKVVVSGCGTSAVVAKKIEHTLCCIECPALFLNPSDAVHGGLGVLRYDDVVILISKGGRTEELYAMIRAIKERASFVVLVTEDETTELALCCDLVLKVKIEQEPDDFNILATSSTLAVISIFDAIAIAITRIRGFSKEQFAVIHPGGDVGKRLSEEKVHGT